MNGANERDGRGGGELRDDEVLERRFDWALREVAGGERAPDVADAVLARAAAGEVVHDGAEPRTWSRAQWLAFAAVFLVGALTVFGVAWLQRAPDHGGVARDEAQQPGGSQILEVARKENIAALPRDLEAVELRNLDDAAVAQLVARCPDLEHLRVWASTMGRRRDDPPAESITDAALPAIAKLARLRRLELVGVVTLTGSGLRNLEALPLLESLAMRFFDVGDDELQVLPRFPSLRELDLGNNQVIGPRGLEAVGKCVGLRRLVLRAIPGQKPDAFAPLRNLSLLESLDLNGINHWTRGVADEATQKRFGLTGGPSPIADGGVVIASLQDWPRLHTLSLAYSRSLEAGVGAALRQRCPRLRDLDVTDCPNVDDTTIAQLVGIPTLRRLVLANCANVGDPGIDLLAASRALQVVDFGTWSWVDDNSTFLTLAQAETLLRSGKRVDWHAPPDRRAGFEALKKKYAAAYGEQRMELVRTTAELEALPESVTHIECRGLGDRAAAILGKRPALVALELVNDAPDDRLTAVGFAAICNLPKLESLVLMNLQEPRGTDFRPLRQLDALRSLSVVGCNFGDEAAAELPKLDRLVDLNVSANRTFTRAAVDSIARCQGLRTLGLAKCQQLDAEAIAQFGALRQLTVLDLSENTGLRDRALMAFRECRAMRRLDLQDGRFTSKGLQALTDMQLLTYLDVSGNDELVPSALLHVPTGVQTLKLARTGGFDASAATLLRDRFPKLAELDVGQNDWITDDVLRTLGDCASLQRLDLVRCARLTNASFATIRGVRSLRWLRITGTACATKEQVAQLRQERPELEVVFDVW
ncbi:MAG TPA: hypothetical protein VF384_06980 [Planctomycetota bacterium]